MRTIRLVQFECESRHCWPPFLFLVKKKKIDEVAFELYSHTVTLGELRTPYHPAHSHSRSLTRSLSFSFSLCRTFMQCRQARTQA